MKTGKDLAFIESPNFPIGLVNSASTKEKGGGGRPPYWEIVFWWTRKPLAGARAVITGALVPENIGKGDFINWLRLSVEKTPHRLNPNLPDEVKEELKKVKLLDPFAGFGSIPLEAIRLGIGEVVAVELLPTAYIFLKAVLDYPKTYSDVKVRISGKELRELGIDGVVKKLTQARKIIDYGVYEIPTLIYDKEKVCQIIPKFLRRGDINGDKSC